MAGLKSVRNRRNDALSRIGWDRLEHLLANHYRRAGYNVEHVGTGGSGRRFDGGIDLKLRKDGACVLVQSKHWNAYQVTHNAVHELLGVMVNERANGAILVTSGEFTRAAIEAATRHGHVQLVDGDALRAMLGPLPELEPPVVSQPEPPVPRAAPALPVPTPRVSVPSRRPTHRPKSSVKSDLIVIVWRLLGAVLLFWCLNLAFKHALKPLLTPRLPMVQEATPARLPEPVGPPPNLMATPAPPYPPVVVSEPEQAFAVPTEPEIRESQRRADEAIKVIEATTPEM